MCGNRVEELEARVQELEASVEGLTDELVECKVRLRELENAVDEDLGFAPEGSSDESAGSEPTTDVNAPEVDKSPDTAEATKSQAHDEEDNTEETEDDIIIA